MDRLSYLPDEIISKILSFIQMKDVMQTMLLSKRWKSLWMFVPRLEFNERTHFPKQEKFQRFVDRSLMSLEGQVLESLYLKLDRIFTHGDIEIWVGTAVKRGLIELRIEYALGLWRSNSFLPKRLYTCEKLVVLKLENGSLDVPDLVCLRSLKTLSLKSMTYSKANALLRLLPNCPVLEDLFLQQKSYHADSLIFKIVVPSLKRSSLIGTSRVGITGLVIDAPKLKSLEILDGSGSLSLSETININEVLKANIDVVLKRPEKLLHSIASVAHLRLCLSASEVVYPDGSCFHRLKHLEVCTCKSEWLLLFMRLLNDSPSLKVIKINQCHPVTNPRPHWNQPGSVPVCLSTNLETFEWINYEGTQYEKELSTYILKTAVCLKKASFTDSSCDYKKKLQKLQELSLSRRVSSTCELVFN